jgi:Ca2+-binding RTX toxin-like protein
VVLIDTGDGGDSVRANNYFGAVALSINSGDGDDTVVGGTGVDTISGGRGADLLDGGLNSDVINAGDGDDTISWNPGGGSDTIDGGAGHDTLVFNTTNIAETIGVSGQGGHVLVTRNIASVALDVHNVERLAFTAAGGQGADTFQIGDLAGTELKQVDIDLGATGDTQVDTVQVAASEGNDALAVAAVDGSTQVTGLFATVAVSHGETIDRLAVAAGGGNDTLDASVLGGGMVVNFDGGEGADVLAFRGGAAVDAVTLAGGSPTAEGQTTFAEVNGAVSQVNVTEVEAVVIDTGDGGDSVRANAYFGAAPLSISSGDGDDTVFGSAGADTISGGRGADLLDGGLNADFVSGGDGDDTISWNPGGGSDIIDGGKGQDSLVFNTSNVSELITLVAYGDHVAVTRDIASITLDVDNVEHIAFGGTGGGSDHFFVAGLEGTDVKAIDIDLGVPAGGGDGAADTILLTASARGDRVVITGDAGSATVQGLAAEVRVTDGEAIDRLTVSGLDGADSFDASGYAGGGLGLRFNGGAGADRFVFGPTGRADVEILEFQAHSGSAEADLIVLNGFADHTFASAVANHHIAQVGADVIVDDGAGAVVRLVGTSLSDLGASDFLFR